MQESLHYHIDINKTRDSPTAFAGFLT